MGAAESSPAEQEFPPGAKTGTYPPAAHSTSDAAVDRVLAALAPLPGLTADEQLAVYDRLHDELLAELNAEQA